MLYNNNLFLLFIFYCIIQSLNCDSVESKNLSSSMKESNGVVDSIINSTQTAKLGSNVTSANVIETTSTPSKASDFTIDFSLSNEQELKYRTTSSVTRTRRSSPISSGIKIAIVDDADDLSYNASKSSKTTRTSKTTKTIKSRDCSLSNANDDYTHTSITTSTYSVTVIVSVSPSSSRSSTISTSKFTPPIVGVESYEFVRNCGHGSIPTQQLRLIISCFIMPLMYI